MENLYTEQLMLVLKECNEFELTNIEWAVRQRVREGKYKKITLDSIDNLHSKFIIQN